jgi:hypothetical protein
MRFPLAVSAIASCSILALPTLLPGRVELRPAAGEGGGSLGSRHALSPPRATISSLTAPRRQN